MSYPAGAEGLVNIINCPLFRPWLYPLQSDVLGMIVNCIVWWCFSPGSLYCHYSWVHSDLVVLVRVIGHLTPEPSLLGQITLRTRSSVLAATERHWWTTCSFKIYPNSFIYTYIMNDNLLKAVGGWRSSCYSGYDIIVK